MRWRWVVPVLVSCCFGCEPYDPPAASSGVYAQCCGGQGSCVPAGLVDTDLQSRLAPDTCAADLLCAPTQLATDPNAKLSPCRAVGDLEGRCLPSCLPDVAARADQLEQGACATGELCTPCFDPRNAEATGACSFGGDRPAESPKTFPSCCNRLGSCVPEASIPVEQRSRLAADGCSAALCVPNAWLDRELPVSCRAPGDLEGRCLPSCLPEIAKRADQLGQGSCEPGLRCSPCFDPRSGEDTGACTTEGDRPREPAKQFAGCCEGTGRCVPAESIAEADRERLAATGCKQAELCAPAEWLNDPRPAPATCRALGDREGRCLSSCLPQVAALGERLERSSCAAEQLCVPCFDPLTGEDTEACRVAPDAGPREAARSFAACCEGLGRCVPAESVPGDERGRLAADSCKGPGELCAPSAWLGDERNAPATCRAPGDLEGRCFPSCLPEIAERADRLAQANCTANHLCLPCFDPLTGEDTQACRSPGDPGPVEAPQQLEVCCGGIGRCVPRTAVDTESQSSLDRGSCRAAFDALCVPEAWIEGDAPVTCRAAGDLEGRCLPRCLPPVAAAGDRVDQASCPDDYACLPCFDPLSGERTGACELSGDPGPAGPAEEFPFCCGELGRCVPSETVADAERGRLGRDSCAAGSDALCVPSAWIEGEAPQSCRAPGDLEGRCLPACLPQVIEQGDRVRRGDCPSAHACLPCFDPLTGRATGACELPGDSGPREPAREFERCCPADGRTLGTCLPRELLPAGQTPPAAAAQLCAAGAVCVPDALVRTRDTGLTACTGGVLGSSARGACVPECLLGSAGGLLQRETCGAAERCVPCSQLDLETPACR